MYTKYNNFVKPCSALSDVRGSYKQPTLLTGEEARQLYLRELNNNGRKNGQNVKTDFVSVAGKITLGCGHALKKTEVTDKDLILAVQKDDIHTIQQILDIAPDKIKILDDYGWSLLMIACQENSTNAVKELLTRGIDPSVRDKAGNSAQSLIIRNKNFQLAGILLSFQNRRKDESILTQSAYDPAEEVRDFFCETCNVMVTVNIKAHLSSTVHNLNLSVGRKIPTNYGIPETNRGFQIMLKAGWDKESGLGPGGTGSKYPIKTIQKQDRKGLGHSKSSLHATQQNVKFKHRRNFFNDKYNKFIEVNFRRQFY